MAETLPVLRNLPFMRKTLVTLNMLIIYLFAGFVIDLEVPDENVRW